MKIGHYTIRLLQPTDAFAFHDLIRRNTARLEDFFAGTVAKTRTQETTEQYVAEIMERIASRTYFPFIVLDTDNTIAGFIDLKNIDWNIPKAELGFFMDEQYAGRGLAKQWMLAVMEHVIAEHRFVKLFLRTHVSNLAAQRLAESCGFEIEGTIRRDYKTTKGELVDLLYYGLIIS
jgi:ribosomal-protein-serine acetyltransferase